MIFSAYTYASAFLSFFLLTAESLAVRQINCLVRKEQWKWDPKMPWSNATKNDNTQCLLCIKSQPFSFRLDR